MILAEKNLENSHHASVVTINLKENKKTLELELNFRLTTLASQTVE